MTTQQQINKINDALKQHADALIETNAYMEARKEKEKARSQWWDGFWSWVCGVILGAALVFVLVCGISEAVWHGAFKQRVQEAIAVRVMGGSDYWEAIKNVGARAEQINEARDRSEKELTSLMKRVDHLSSEIVTLKGITTVTGSTIQVPATASDFYWWTNWTNWIPMSNKWP